MGLAREQSLVVKLFCGPEGGLKTERDQSCGDVSTSGRNGWGEKVGRLPRCRFSGRGKASRKEPGGYVNVDRQPELARRRGSRPMRGPNDATDLSFRLPGKSENFEFGWGSKLKDHLT